MIKTFILVSFISFGLAACSTQNNDGEKTAHVSSPDVTSPILKDIDVAEFKAKMAAPNVVVLDVRTLAETAQGKMGEALELDFRSDSFAAGLDQLDKEKGFREFYNLEGGDTAWSKEQEMRDKQLKINFL